MSRSTSHSFTPVQLHGEGTAGGTAPRHAAGRSWLSALVGLMAAALFVGCASHPARAQRAGVSPQRWSEPGHRGHRHTGGGIGSDVAARLLDHQTVLGLSGDQVTRLIAVHQQSLASARPIREKMMAMFPHTPGQQRPQLSAAQRDSIGGMMESLREIRWRSAASADSVLTDDQRAAAARLVWAARGAGGPGGPGGHGGAGMRGGRPPRPDGEEGSD